MGIKDAQGHEWSVVSSAEHPFLTLWDCKHCQAVTSTQDGCYPADMPHSKKPCLPTTGQVVCKLCQDTHIMPATGWMCTQCPSPCQQCRAGGYGAFCEHTPCSCKCHDKQHAELMQWYQEPLTKEHIAQLRYKLAQARGLLLAYRVNLPPTAEELQAIIDETQDP